MLHAEAGNGRFSVTGASATSGESQAGVGRNGRPLRRLLEDTCTTSRIPWDSHGRDGSVVSLRERRCIPTRRETVRLSRQWRVHVAAVITASGRSKSDTEWALWAAEG